MEKHKFTQEEMSKLGRIIKKALVYIVAFWILWSSFYIIQSGERGLKFTLGELQNMELDEGFGLKVPFFQKVRTFTIRPIPLETAIEVGATGAITKDNQTVGASITAFYRYSDKLLPKMYREYGEDKIRLIVEKTVLESFKKVIGGYNIFEIPTNQQAIITKVKELLLSSMTEYDIVVITDFKLTNFDWSDDFDSQIKATMQRAQQVKQKEQELLITEQEANKLVKQAEAEKNAKIMNAEGELASKKLLAEAKTAEGEGIRKYNQAVAANMDLEIRIRQLEIEKLRVEKWNGVYVPNNNYTPIPVSSGILQGK
jgi:regulator of protease activity HflC (stomatin/prohibitin superfamily)